MYTQIFIKVNLLSPNAFSKELHTRNHTHVASQQTFGLKTSSIL